MSSVGDLYALKYDMRYPFVEWMAGEMEKAETSTWGGTYDTLVIPIDHLRRSSSPSSLSTAVSLLCRYDIGTISREGPGLSLSKKHLQADIDFVTAPLPHITETTLKDKVQVGKLLSEQLLAEAEIIKIVTEVLQALKISETEHKLEVRLGHACILHACLEQINTSAELLSSVLQNISTVKRLSPCGPTRSENWLSIQPALEDLGLSSSEIRNWKRFVTKLSGECRSALPQLMSALSNNGQNPLHAPLALAFEEIRSLMSLLETWKLGTEQIVMDPILFPEADYYSGIYFEVHLVHLTKKSSSEVAIGGRSCVLSNDAYTVH